MRPPLTLPPREEPELRPQALAAPVRQKKTPERDPPILVRRQGGALLGAADMDVELITRLDAGAVLQVRVTQERHVGRHRLYWAILGIVADNLPSPIRPEQLHQAVKLMLGVSIVVPFGDRDIIVPGSIAFASMSEPAFRDFLDRFLVLVTERLLPGVDITALEREGRERVGPDPAPAKRIAPSRRAKAA